MDKLYKCITCNYSTKHKSNLYHHNKTKKHIENTTIKKASISESSQWTASELSVNYQNHVKSVNKSAYVCEYCNKSIIRYNNVNKHLNSCIKKKKNEMNLIDQIKKLNNELELIKTKNEHNEHYKAEAAYYKQMLLEAGGLVKKSVSALTYSITNFDSAPSIETIQVDDVSIFDGATKEIVENIISAYKHKTLDRHIGDLILKLYKKENPLDQSIWNTDDNRLTYIIKELLNNKSSNWIVDKKGVKTVQYLISPLLEYIKKLIITYQENYSIPESTRNVVEIDMLLENNKKIIEIINGIDDGNIAKDVLKFISTHLRFNDSSLIK